MTQILGGKKMLQYKMAAYPWLPIPALNDFHREACQLKQESTEEQYLLIAAAGVTPSIAMRQMLFPSEIRLPLYFPLQLFKIAKC